MDLFVWSPWCVVLSLRNTSSGLQTGRRVTFFAPSKDPFPSTQARQRLNWFSIVNLGSVGKENVRSLMLLLQRPGSSFKIFPAQKTRANKGGQHVHFFFPFHLLFFIGATEKPLEPRTLLLRFTPSRVTSLSVLLLSARRCIAFCSGQLFCLCCFSHMVQQPTDCRFCFTGVTLTRYADNGQHVHFTTIAVIAKSCKFPLCSGKWKLRDKSVPTLFHLVVFSNLLCTSPRLIPRFLLRKMGSSKEEKSPV